MYQTSENAGSGQYLLAQACIFQYLGKYSCSLRFPCYGIILGVTNSTRRVVHAVMFCMFSSSIRNNSHYNICGFILISVDIHLKHVWYRLHVFHCLDLEINMKATIFVLVMNQRF